MRNAGAGNPSNATPNGYTAYGGLGQYFITGSIIPSGAIIPPGATLQVTDINEPGVGAIQMTSLNSNPAQNDIGWNIDDVQLLGDGNVDTTPPLATINLGNLTTAGAPTHSFTVTYSDSSAVTVASLGSSNLVVTGPNGFSNLVDFVGVDTLTDGTPRIASYSIRAPAGIWDAADNGSYQIAIQDGEVTDVFNNAIAEAVLATFTVAISTNHQAIVVTPAFLSVTEGSNAVFTVRLAEQPMADVAVRVVRASGDDDITLLDGATNVFTAQNWSNAVPVTIAALPDPDQTNGTATFECHSDGLATVAVLVNEQDATPNSILSVSVNNPAWGTVAPMDVSFPVGAAIQVSATPSHYFRFVQWTGGYLTTDNPLSVILNSNLTLQAVFAEIVTTNHLTPYWWLAANGHTENLEAAEEVTGANGLPLWQSYLAGLNPNDPESQFRVQLTIETGNMAVLRWNTVTGRVYSLFQSTNLLEGFAPLPGATNLPASQQNFTNLIGSGPGTFYRLEVRKP